MRVGDLIGVIGALGLAGCAYAFTLSPRDGGEMASTSIPMPLASYHGELRITVAGKPYAGPWVYAPGGSAGLGVALGGRGAATGAFLGADLSGPGSANLRAPDGSTLRCVFTFSQASDTGLGECEGSDGRAYDLQIHH